MLGQADAGKNVLIDYVISNPIFIIAFYGYVKLCSDWWWRVKGSSFTRPHGRPCLPVPQSGPNPVRLNPVR